jgi:hypothetical protein
VGLGLAIGISVYFFPLDLGSHNAGTPSAAKPTAGTREPIADRPLETKKDAENASMEVAAADKAPNAATGNEIVVAMQPTDKAEADRAGTAARDTARPADSLARVAAEKTAGGKATADKPAKADKSPADAAAKKDVMVAKAAAQKAAVEKTMADKAAADNAAAEKVAVIVKAAADKAAAVAKAAPDKTGAESALPDQAATQKTMPDKVAVEQTAASTKASGEIVAAAKPSLLQDQMLRNLLDQLQYFMTRKDLAGLEQISTLSENRRRLLEALFENYTVIEVSLTDVTGSATAANAVLRINRLVLPNGDVVDPTPLLRTTRITIPREGDKWGRLVW